MANNLKAKFLGELQQKFGAVHKLKNSESLFEIGDGAGRVYIRYSKVHQNGRTFFGLRDTDLSQLEGYPSVVCFLWPEQLQPLLVPFSEYESVFHSIRPAGDGQYKALVYPHSDGTELYIANAGRFNVEGHFGWEPLTALMDASRLTHIPDLTHPKVQTLLGAIGAAKGYAIWIPSGDRCTLDWSLADAFNCNHSLPSAFERVTNVLEEIDVVWLERGSGQLKALFEVEHSTPIYSGLLRFNDILLAAPALRPRFTIAANELRRDVFTKQVNRLTFKASGLNELCTFLQYPNVYAWYQRTKQGAPA